MQTVNSTTEVPVNISDIISNPVSPYTCPYELVAGFVSSFPGSSLWLNLCSIGDDSFAAAVAAKIAAHIGPTNDVILEHGNEHWNFAPAFHEWGCEHQALQLGRYMPPGHTLFGYYPTNGQDTNRSDNTTWYALEATHQYDVFTAAWVAAGLDPSRIKRVYGSWWTSSGTTATICNAATSYGFPAFYGCAVAPYHGGNAPNDLTPVIAFSPAGYPGSIPGNWPCDAINDFARHLLFYNPNNWEQWALTQAALPSGTRMVAYESSIDYLMPSSVPAAQLLTEDCFYHPSFPAVGHASSSCDRHHSELREQGNLKQLDRGTESKTTE